MKHLFALLSFFLLFSFQLRAQEAHMPGEMIVMMKYQQPVGEMITRLNTLHPGADFVVKRTLSEDWNTWLLAFDPAFLPDQEALRMVTSYSTVALAQFNHIIAQRAIPNDPSFGTQWSLNNTGQSGGTVDADIDAPEAWDITTGGLTTLGDTIVVAVIDGGMQINHPDLQANIYRNYLEIPGNNIDDDLNGYIDDVNGWNAYNNNGNVSTDNHGTHVGGIIGARGNNGAGVSGVNWNVKIMPIGGSSGNEAIVVAAYGYAGKMRKLYNQTNGQQGAFVVATNSSFGVDYANPNNFPIWCAFYDSLGAVGILSAVAGPNQNANIDQVGDVPGACPSNYTISVTNTTHNDVKTGSAGYGPINTDIGAPGSSIYNTVTTSSYGNLSGTSMATPHVAGAVGLLWSAACPQMVIDYKINPAVLAMQMRTYIFEGVDSLSSLANLVATQGRLNIHKGILRVQSYNCNQPPIASFNNSAANGCPGLTVQFNNTTLGSVDSLTWYFPGGVPSSSNLPNPLITYPNLGVFDVALVAYNTYGEDSITFTNHVDINTFGTQTIFTEDFEIPDFTSGGWSVQNPDNANTWILATVAGTTPGTTAAGVNIFNHQSNAGQVDALISPIIDLSLHTSNTLTFEHAHRRRLSNLRDSLWVSISTDGGTSWNSLLRTAENGNGAFATGFLLTQDFIPASSTDWCFNAPTNVVCFSLDLTAYDGNPNVKLKFEVQNNGGNNIYIDNLKITGICSVPPPQEPVAAFSADQQNICEGETIQFTDLSTNTPVNWNWNFPGGTPASSNVQHPSIIYSTAGTYMVSLTASNPGGSNTVTMNGLITVHPLPAQPVIAQNGNQLQSSYPTGNQWNNLGNPIPNETGQLFNPVQSGTYSVTYTDINGCAVTSEDFIFYLGQEENALYGVWIYPNPVQDFIMIQWNESPEYVHSVRLMDAAGRMVFLQNIITTNTLQIPASDFAKGIYLLEIQMKSGVLLQQKLVK